jgi:hypothetical protein
MGIALLLLYIKVLEARTLSLSICVTVPCCCAYFPNINVCLCKFLVEQLLDMTGVKTLFE